MYAATQLKSKVIASVGSCNWPPACPTQISSLISSLLTHVHNFFFGCFREFSFGQRDKDVRCRSGNAIAASASS